LQDRFIYENDTGLAVRRHCLSTRMQSRNCNRINIGTHLGWREIQRVNMICVLPCIINVGEVI